MRSPNFPVCLLFSALALSLSNAEPTADSNSTEIVVEQEDDESLPEITLDEFKERYRRLIPYMTFYVANNIANGQIPITQNTQLEIQNSFLLRKAPQNLVRVNNIPRRGNNPRVNLQNQDKKFVPSVQYDPHDLGSDTDYFTPIRYSERVGYEDYSVPYQLQLDRKGGYPEITTASNQISRKETRYYSNVRPLRPYTTNRKGPPHRKPPAQAGYVRDDYFVDYKTKLSGNKINYQVKEFQGLRQPSPSPYPTAALLEPSQIVRNPNINLNQISESLQLSERLPEMLNKNNFDFSVRTLLEILNILHNKRKGNLQTPQLTSPAPSRFPQKVANYESYKPRPQTKPKVITETRFQATPNPLYLTDDPERYKVSYEGEVRPKPIPTSTSPPNYNQIVEYYSPIVQDIPANTEVFLPTIRPQGPEVTTQHSYDITEDLSDDVQEVQFTPPQVTTTSTTHRYTKPNKVSTPKPSLSQNSLQYGATRGMANVHYPAYSSIPITNFSCKEQRYKGFFGDPDTGCQVWHYCDLNGGKSSFLCPNGTIFSQVALTCDWWFNVKCETTAQLYVLNERLYKYILPIMPKFPEDFTGPEVDRYLELKFKEMEAKLKEKKLKKQQEEKAKLKDKPQSEKENE